MIYVGVWGVVFLGRTQATRTPMFHMIEEQCPCGRPLHYSDPAMRRIVERLVASNGPDLKVIVGKLTYHVPRHWIALHGLQAWRLPILAQYYGWRIENEEAHIANG